MEKGSKGIFRIPWSLHSGSFQIIPFIPHTSTKPRTLLEKRGFNNLSMASPFNKGFKQVVKPLTMPYPIKSIIINLHLFSFKKLI
jgi:hypothetical protein